MNLKKTIAIFVSILITLTLLCGCGYSNKSLISRNIESIYIPIFENDTFIRGIEFGLTKAVKDEIMSKTNLRIVHKDYADCILIGRIKRFTETTLTENTRDRIVESRITFYVNIVLVDRRTKRELIRKDDIKQENEYIVKRGETLESSMEEGMLNMAKTIVHNLEEKW